MKRLWVLFLSVLLCGCSAPRYTIVSMMGYDVAEAGYTATAKIDVYDETVYISETGALPYDTINKLSLTADKTVALGEASCNVLSKALAEKGLKEMANSLYTGSYSRGDDLIVITDGSAAEYLHFHSGAPQSSAYSVQTSVQKFIQDSISPSRTALVQYASGKNALMCAVSGYKLRLILSEKESAGALLFSGNAEGIKSINTGDAFVGVEISAVAPKIEVSKENGEILFSVYPEIGFTVKDMTTGFSDIGLTFKIETALNSLVSEEIYAAFLRSTSSNVDFLGLKNIYRLHYDDDDFNLSQAKMQVFPKSKIIYGGD